MEPATDTQSFCVPTTPELYRHFGRVEAESSPIYTELALAVADDPRVIALIDELPRPKRQPNLVFAAARYMGAPVASYRQFRAWLADHWSDVKSVALTHATQTNEAARCAMLLPLLAEIPGPLALLEVGTSAGLCLYPDRYSYRYDDRPQIDPVDGPSPVVLAVSTSGPVPYPTSLPNVVWRAGVDMNPLDVKDPDDVAWLDALIWPEHDDRRVRLRAAVSLVRADPPRVLTGGLLDELPALAASAPNSATLVVYHTAVLAYLSAADRERFVKTVASVPGRWISNEGSAVTPGVAERLRGVQPEPGEFILALDGDPVAFTQPHGRNVRWLGVR